MSRPIHQSQIFLDSVGINFNRDVYIHGIPQQFTTGITIYAHSLTKPSEGKHPTSYAVPSPVPNLQEQRPDNPDKAVACIFVGMTLSPTKLAELRATHKFKPTDQKRKVRGMSVVQLGKEGDIVEATLYDPNALRVVAKKSGKTACFYALMNPNEKGLCLGVLVPSEDVFFFKSCRDDDARTVQARKDTFAAKIRDFMAGHGANGPTFAAIKRKWIKEEDSDDGVKSDRSRSLSAEDPAQEDTVPVKKARLKDIMGLMLTAQEKGDQGSLAVAINEMRAIEQTEASTSPSSGLFTSAFLPPVSITNELCVQVLSDIKFFAPELIKQHRLTTQEVHFVLLAMKKAKTHLYMQDIIPYFLGFIQELRRTFTHGTPEALEPAMLNACSIKAYDALMATRVNQRAENDGYYD